jgi:GDP-L-fucose synthase
MRIFITGSGGMVGGALAGSEALQAHDLVTPRSVDLDLTDRDAVRRALDEAQPDVIVHCAGRVGGIEANRHNNSRFLLDNALMGLHVVSAADELEVPYLINLASSCIYPKDRTGALSEDLILDGPLEPTNEGYALAKIATLRMAQFARRERGRRFHTAIPCNLYGPGDSFDPVRAHLIPSAIRKVHEAKAHGGDVEIWGDGSARREFMFVDDLTDYLVAALGRLDDLPELLNVGLGHDHSVLEYYTAIAEVVGFDRDFTFDRDRPVGMKRKLLDCSQVHEWGWRAQRSLTEGLEATYNHFLRKHEAT